MRHILQNIINLFQRQKPTNFARKSPYVDHSKTYQLDNDLKDDFYLNLQKTIVWTEEIISEIEDYSKINYGKVLRTTNPIYDGKPFYKFYNTHDYLVATPDIGFYYKIVLSDALKIRQNAILPQKQLEEIGKILKFEIDLTTHDGAPCEESGFVDESDIPPIDTWFYITTKFLYCWIPTMFIDKMQDAIDVEIFGSYSWLADINPELNRFVLDKLRQSGS